MNNFIQTLSERKGELLEAAFQHLSISLISLLIAALIAIPLAIWAANHKKMAEVLLQITGVLQTIPSLALLGLLIPFVGIGTVPACCIRYPLSYIISFKSGDWCQFWGFP